MPKYLVDFEYTVREYGDVTLDAMNETAAVDEAYNYVRETFNDVDDIEVTDVRELVD